MTNCEICGEGYECESSGRASGTVQMLSNDVWEIYIDTFLMPTVRSGGALTMRGFEAMVDAVNTTDI